MNLEQTQQDVDNGIMICRATVHKLLKAAALMEQALINLSEGDGHKADYARAVVYEVSRM